MASKLFVSPSGNLSLAWAAAFLNIMRAGITELSPLLVSVTDFENEIPRETEVIRSLLDQHLQRLGLQSCHTVANTIFPDSFWNPSSPNDADTLFARFDRAWPRLHRCPANHRGSYFRRLTSYCPDGLTEPVNQLQHIIDTYRGGNHRRSALQASVFDPTRDHNNCRQLGFPCLQQVAFVPMEGNGLSVTGYYATQYLVERAYGNYLGLCRLGRFMAKQLGLRLVKLICIASVGQRGRPTKSALQPLADQLTAACPDLVEARG